MDKLGWENFERLCLRLLRTTQEIVAVTASPGIAAAPVTRPYGVKGQAQHGIDVYSRDPLLLDGTVATRSVVCLQSRRVRGVSKTGLKNAVTQFLQGVWAKSSRKFIYATSAGAVRSELSDEIENQAARTSKVGIEFEVWDAEELSERLRAHPQLVDDFFGRAWVTEFCGSEAASRLAQRLSGPEVAELREELRRIYIASFGLADAGTNMSTTAISAIPLTQKFVTPDVLQLRDNGVPTLGSRRMSTTGGLGGTAEDMGSVVGADGRAEVADADRSAALLLGDARGRGRGGLDDDWLPLGRSIKDIREPLRSGASPAAEWIGTGPRQVVIGEPGAGKSTLLRHLVLDLLDDEPAWPGVAERWGDRLPVWLPFHFFTQRVIDKTGHEASLVQAIKAWLEQHDIERVWPLVERALEDDRLLLVVDGLDEWSAIEAGEYAATALEMFAAARSVALVVSTRPYGLQRLTLGSGWTYGRIASLSPAQQRAIARTHFEHSLEEAARTPEAIDTSVDAFMTEVRASADLRVMAGVPLFLVLLANLRIATGARLPNRRFEVFDRAIGLLVREHPTRRRVAAAVTTTRQGLKERPLRLVLAQVAYEAQVRGDLRTIAEQDLQRDLISALRDPDVLALDRAAAIVQADAIADVAEGELGLLVRQGPHEVSFIHRSLQEQLAAEHVVNRLTPEEQHNVLLTRLGDVRWREVLLGVMWQTSRPDERRRLAEALAERIDETPIGLVAAEVLAEIVFGPYELPGGMSREQAQKLAERIETHPVLSHRARLVERFVTGIGNVAVHEEVVSRLTLWTGLAEPPRRNLVRQLGSLLIDDGLTLTVPVLVDALSHLDHDIAWTAATVLVQWLATAPDTPDERRFVRAGVDRVLAAPTSATSAAAALTVLLLEWPEGEHAVEAAETYRLSQSGAARMVALAHVAGVLGEGFVGEPATGSPTVDRLTAQERSWLHSQVSERSDRGAHDGIDLVLISAAAQDNPETLEHVLQGMRRGSGLDIDWIWAIALHAFATEDRVAEFVAQQIANEERPWPLLSIGFGRGHLGVAFGPDSPHRDIIAEAIEKHIERFDATHHEVEMHDLAAIDQGPRMRQTLLQALQNSTVPHWPAAALLAHFAHDEEAMSMVRAALTTDPVQTSRLAAYANEVLGPEEGRERLLAVLREVTSRPGLARGARLDMIASGIIACCKDLEDPDQREAICSEVLGLLPEEGRWDADARFETACHFYPSPSARRFLEESGRNPDGRFLPGLLRAHRNEPSTIRDLIKRAGDLLRVPPPSIRYLIHELLAADPTDPQVALTCGAGWADESAEPVKSIASLAYHQSLAAERLRGNVSDHDWNAARSHLGEVASCYGPDHEARRRAAWIGMCVLRDWSPIDSKTETIGDTPHPVGVPLGDPFRGGDDVLLDQVGSHWTELREHFGHDLIRRLSGLRATDARATAWDQLAKVASHYPALDAELRREVEGDPELLSQQGITAWYVADPRRSRAVATEAVGRVITTESNQRNTTVRMAQDPDLLGLDAVRLVGMINEAHPDHVVGGFGSAELETLAVLQPDHPVIEVLWRAIAKVIGYKPVVEEASHDHPGDPDEPALFGPKGEGLHPHTYLAIAYARIPTEHIGWLVTRDLHWLTGGSSQLSYYESALVHHLRRRLRGNPDAAASIQAASRRENVPVEVATQILAILAAASPARTAGTDAIDACLKRIIGQPFTPLIRDVVLGASVSAYTSLQVAATIS